MPGPSIEPAEVAAAAVDFAAQRLGPGCARLVQDPALQALIVSRVRANSDPIGGSSPTSARSPIADAVLSAVHSRLATDPTLADEFLSFFLSDLARLGHGTLGPGLRRFLDSGDLVQSVLGDLWPELAAVKFESRDSFLALLAARLRWKAADGARQLRAGKRREDLRSDVDAALMADDQAGPSTELVAAEEWQQTALALSRLPQRDRQLVRGHLQGLSWSELAKAHGLQPESARKAVQRALIRMRGGVGQSEGGER
jgi:RNA polymerase sigma factor (sigma-70 family)